MERIRQGLLRQEFMLHYQPKVNMRTGKVVGVEALARWLHPEKGLLDPSFFLPVINDDPLAPAFDDWVLSAALAQIGAWRARGLKIPVSVNVSARLLQQADFIPHLLALMAAHPQVQPDDLQLEVLETNALEDLAHAAQVIDACRDLGILFALDDFGTGYSSLTYLKRLQVYQLKIDKSFVSNMLDDPDDLSILEGVIGLATAFRCEVIAEGLALKEHGAMLLQLGCDLAQGYGIARPMPASEVPDWIARWQPDPAWQNLKPVNREDLPLLFSSVEHRAWIRAIENYISGEREAPPSLNQKESHFGQWLAGEGASHYQGNPMFTGTQSSFESTYQLGAQLCQQFALGKKTEVKAQLGGLLRARDDFLRQVQQLLQVNQTRA